MGRPPTLLQKAASSTKCEDQTRSLMMLFLVRQCQTWWQCCSLEDQVLTVQMSIFAPELLGAFVVTVSVHAYTYVISSLSYNRSVGSCIPFFSSFALACSCFPSFPRSTQWDLQVFFSTERCYSGTPSSEPPISLETTPPIQHVAVSPATPAGPTKTRGTL